jgi:hypothetical protein
MSSKAKAEIDGQTRATPQIIAIYIMKIGMLKVLPLLETVDRLGRELPV